MKSFVKMLLVLCFTALVFSIACDRFKLVPDPPEVVDVPGYSEESTIQPTGLNDQNLIIGYHGGAYPVTIAENYDLVEATGFVIRSDETDFVELNQPNHHNNWPYAINNQGQIVGAYMPDGNHTSEYLPAFAYQINADGTGFEDLHPTGAFYSIATDITTDGLVLGHYGYQPLNSTACIFSGDTVINLVDPDRISFSKIACSNDQYAIIYGMLSNDVYAYFSYEYETATLRQLAIDAKTADFSELQGINNHNIAVGFYIDLNVSALARGITYDLETDILSEYQEVNEKGGSSYYEYNFFDINDAGAIVGRAGREYGGGGLLQQRAMAIHADFSGFGDITPENDGIYSEMIAINNHGLALGYLGLPRKNLAVANKLFVIQVD